MNALTLFAFAAVATYVSASGIGTYVDGYGGAVTKGPSGAITSHETPGTISYGTPHGGVISHGTGSYGTTYYDSPIGHGIGIYGGAYGMGHGVSGYGGYRPVPTVVTGPQTHAVITGPQIHPVVTPPQTNAVVSGPRTHTVITGPVATAEIRGPQFHAVLTPPIALNVAAGHDIISQGIGYQYGPGHSGVVDNGYGHGGVALVRGAIISYNDEVRASHHGAIVERPRTAPALIGGPSGKVYAEGLWGPTTRGLQVYGHGW